MPIVIGAVAPHGFPIIPDLSDDADGALKTREAMLEMGRRFAEARPDVVFISGPHGIRVNGFVSLADCARGAGTLFWGDRKVEMNIPFDLTLTDAIAERARERGVPVAQVGYGGSNRNQSILPMDWGVMTPLWFAGHDQNHTGKGHVLAALFEGVPETSGPPAVIANPSRMIPRQMNVEFGKAVAEAAEADGRRVAFIASCDWAHRHDANHPNGFHPDAPKLDAEVVEAIKANDIMRLLDLNEQYVQNAAIDGLWQLLMLAGAQQVVPMEMDFLSYEAPTYYGMIVATCTPTRR
jgi:aromatic ring-opening dioxygenase LigB subunit